MREVLEMLADATLEKQGSIREFLQKQVLPHVRLAQGSQRCPKD